MKIIVVSDSHGAMLRLNEVMRLHRDADAFVFLGDGLSDVFHSEIDRYIFARYFVRGNCDIYFPLAEDVDKELTVSFGAYKFLILHGHTRRAKYGYSELICGAKESRADVVLFGHTHEPLEKYISEDDGGPLYLFNPGSLGYSADGEAHFGIIEIRDDNILFSHGVLKK